MLVVVVCVFVSIEFRFQSKCRECCLLVVVVVGVFVKDQVDVVVVRLVRS